MGIRDLLPGGSDGRALPREITASVRVHQGMDALDVDEFYDVARSARRRQVIRTLADTGPLTKGDLADRMAWERYGPEYDTAERKRMYVSLHQTHLDVLLEAGFVVQSDRDGRYRLTADGERVVGLLDATEQMAQGGDGDG